MINIILFGPPGSGKGTQATLLVERHHLVHISTGDMFRHHLAHHTALGQEAKTYMDKGELVPDHVTIGMLRNRVESEGEVSGYIFDGFPRTIAQADALTELMQEEGTQIHALIKLEVPDEEIVSRLLNRGLVSGRKDDQDEETIRHRIRVYHEETEPVFDYFTKLDRSFSVDGLGSIEEIAHRLDAVMEHLAAIYSEV